MRYSQAYFDNLSSAPVSPEVCSEMDKYYREHYGHPGAPHQFGRWNKTALEAFAEETANVLGVGDLPIRFCLGSDSFKNTAVIEIIASPIEGNTIINQLRKNNIQPRFFKMDGFEYDLESIQDILCGSRQKKIVIATSADRITGTVQPIDKISEICNMNDALLWVDFTPLVGRAFFDFKASGANFGYIEGRSIGAPCDIIIGEELDYDFPPPLAAGFLKNIKLLYDGLDAKISSLSDLSEYFWKLLQMHLPHIVLLGKEPRVSGILAIAFEDVDRCSMLVSLDMQGIALDSSDDISTVSQRLLTMGVPQEIAECVLGFALWHQNTQAEIDYVLHAIPPIVDRIRWEKGSPKFRA